MKQELLKFKSRRQVEIDNEGMAMSFRQLMKYFWDDGMAITKRIYPYVILGVGIGAIIHGFVPTSVVETTLANKSWWSIPLATLIGAPLYANSVSVIPIMDALINKGVPMGTALAFMTSIVTVSIPELMILKKVMRWQLLTMFLGVTLTGIMLIGYLFNYIVI